MSDLTPTIIYNTSYSEKMFDNGKIKHDLNIRSNFDGNKGFIYTDVNGKHFEKKINKYDIYNLLTNIHNIQNSSISELKNNFNKSIKNIKKNKIKKNKSNKKMSKKMSKKMFKNINKSN